MRILHVITALGVGGAERMLLKLLDARALSGVDQQVIAMLPGGALAEAARATGASIEELDFLGGLPPLTGAAKLVRVGRRWNPDLVHGWLYHGNLGASLVRATLPRRVPLIWSMRQSLPSLKGENMFARTAIMLNKALSGHADRMLFNSLASEAQHRAYGFVVKRATCIPNGFDVEAFAPDAAARSRWRATWDIDDDTVVFGLFARYHPVKDHAGFLRAAQLVNASRPATRFVMAGTGVNEANESLVAAIRSAGLTRHVQLLGELHDVAGLLPALDVCVSSSTSEAFSNAIGEAMSCGLPCVVTDVGESPKVVADTGLVVPPRDPRALADAMIEMVDLGASARAAFGSRARQRVADQFNIDAVAARHAALYDQLTGSTR